MVNERGLLLSQNTALCDLFLTKQRPFISLSCQNLGFQWKVLSLRQARLKMLRKMCQPETVRSLDVPISKQSTACLFLFLFGCFIGSKVMHGADKALHNCENQGKNTIGGVFPLVYQLLWPNYFLNVWHGIIKDWHMVMNWFQYVFNGIIHMEYIVKLRDSDSTQ